MARLMLPSFWIRPIIGPQSGQNHHGYQAWEWLEAGAKEIASEPRGFRNIANWKITILGES